MSGPVGWNSRRRRGARACGSRTSREVQARQAAVGEHLRGGLVDRREGHGDAGVAGHAHELGEVGLVGAVRPVLVLDLHEDHGPARVDLARRHDLVHATEIAAHRLRGSAARSAARPPRGRGTATRAGPVVPLGADVRAGTHDRVHALGGDEVEEPAQVEPAVGAPFASARLVRVPRDVGLDGVEAHEPGLADAVRPQVGVHAEVVQRAREDAERTPVELEVGRPDGEAGVGGHWHPFWWFCLMGRLFDGRGRPGVPDRPHRVATTTR